MDPQEQQALTLRAEEIDRMQRPRHPVQRNQFRVVLDAVEWIERLAIEAQRHRLKTQFIAESIHALRRRRERLGKRVHADVEDRLVGARQFETSETSDCAVVVDAFTQRQMFAEKRMFGGTGHELGNGLRDHE